MTAVRIVVGIDGSDASREALGWAVRWAEALGGEVVAVHAVGLLEHRQGLGSDAARRTLVESTWAAPLASTTCAHRVELKDGAALDVLLATATAERADLLVVGSRGTGDDPDRALGSTSLHVLQEAGLPVLVVPAAGPVAAADAPVLRRILVGVDRSAPALAALGLAADVAAALGGSLTVLEAIEYVPPFPLGAATAGTGTTEELGVARARLESAVSELRRRGLAVQVVVRSGDPAPTLLEVADDIDADLVVLGTRGRGGPGELMLGSVARTVADRVRRPTLVLPAAAGAARLGGGAADSPGPARRSATRSG
jgi:nucleotide-binding universal stress UspA family protein